MLGVALGGLLLLIVIAGTVGHLDARARSRAWSRIDAARNQRPIGGRRLPDRPERPLCTSCPQDRPFGDRYAG